MKQVLDPPLVELPLVDNVLERILKEKIAQIDGIRGRRAKLYDLIDQELISARRKFPDATKMFAVIAEELGELAEAFLHYDSGEYIKKRGYTKEEAHEHIVLEGIQVLSMVIRLLEEGDPSFTWDPPDWLVYPPPLQPGQRHDLGNI